MANHDIAIEQAVLLLRVYESENAQLKADLEQRDLENARLRTAVEEWRTSYFHILRELSGHCCLAAADWARAEAAQNTTDG